MSRTADASEEFGSGMYSVPCMIRAPSNKLLSTVNYVLLRTRDWPLRRFDVCIKPIVSGDGNDRYAYCFVKDGPGMLTQPIEWPSGGYITYRLGVSRRNEPEVEMDIYRRPGEDVQ